MLHYLLLAVYTIIILFLTWKIWKKTRELAFVLGSGLMYYWSLLGAWFIVYDDLNGQKGKEFGLHYYHYLVQLFPVHADNYYLAACALYAAFIIGVLAIVLWKGKAYNPVDNEGTSPVYINHLLLIALCTGAALLSCMLVWKEILTAAKFEQSIYVVTRHQPSRFFTLHQLLNQGAVVALYIGLIAFVSGDNARYMTGSRKKWTIIAYVLAVAFVEGYLLLLGNKREILFGGILGIIFYFTNVRYKINVKALSIFIVIILIPLVFNDGLRAYSPKFLTKYFDTTGLEYHPDIDIVYTEFSAKNTAFTFLFSNEMFASHFSMYGVLSHHVPLTYGSSLASLGASVVPRALWPSRPSTIYDYYAEQVGAAKGTGYTIHQATGWYLNFGVIGVLLGAAAFGFSWIWLYNRFRKLALVKNLFLKVFFIIAFAAFTAQVPAMMRTGPEGYKALIFEALLLPAIIVYVAMRFGKRKDPGTGS